MKFLLLMTTLFCFQAHAAWDLNDVSYVMPLPASIEDQGLLRPLSVGAKGSILTQEILLALPALNAGEAVLEKVRLMAVRIDPCFPLPTPQSCQKQIRMVWQPLTLGFDGDVQTVDAAIHSFYVLTDAEFDSLLKDLAAWKKNTNVSTSLLPLQVHPAWAQEGTDSAHLEGFNKIVLKYAGNANLTRVTAMLLRRGGLMWTFVGYSVINGKLEPFDIPRLGPKKTQMFINLAQPMDHFASGGMSPFPRGADIINTLVSRSDMLDEKDEDLIRSEARAAYRIENPKNFSPENMDCVSCHTAGPAVHWVLNKRPQLKVDQLWNGDIYKNAKFNLSNESAEAWNTQVIRGIGYFGKNLAISQRVINESAEVADSLNLKK